MERIVAVKPVGKYLLELEFRDGFRKVVDLEPFTGKGISEALRDAVYFRSVHVEEGGGIAWDNGYDFCPNFLRHDVPAVKPVPV